MRVWNGIGSVNLKNPLEGKPEMNAGQLQMKDL